MAPSLASLNHTTHPTKGETMNQAQRKILVDRLNGANRRHRNSLYYRAEKATEPAEIKAARALIKKYEDRERTRSSTQLDKVDAAYKAAEEAIHFGEEKAALAAVKKFEASKF